MRNKRGKKYKAYIAHKDTKDTLDKKVAICGLTVRFKAIFANAQKYTVKLANHTRVSENWVHGKIVKTYPLNCKNIPPNVFQCNFLQSNYLARSSVKLFTTTPYILY